MINFIVTYDKSVLKALEVQIMNAPKEVVVYVKNVIPVFLHKEIKPLVTEPREPTLPFIWSHDPAQQRALRNAYFRTLPKGSRGGRYRRTHELVKAWQVASKAQPGGAEVSVLNDTPHLDTVQGDEQYPSHRDSGWVQYDGVLEKAAERSIDMIIGKWFDVLSGGGP